jgi:predicted Zn-ribbon and HTH transcriptional regulator
MNFFLFCDKNPNVLKWSSEEIVVPYYDTVQEKWRRYYVDAFVEILEGDNKKKYLVELKDIRATVKPTVSKRKKKSTIIYEQTQYQNNLDKWEHAKKFAKDKGMEFIVLGFCKKDGFQMVKV